MSADLSEVLKDCNSTGDPFLMQQIISCEIRNDLIERQHRAMREYRTSVALMENLLGHAQFNEATERAECAQARYHQAREELSKHLEEHGC